MQIAFSSWLPHVQAPAHSADCSLGVQPFTSSEGQEIEGAIVEGIQIIETLLSLGIDRAISGKRV